MSDPIRIPVCPMCSQPPAMGLQPGTQVFCGTDDCPVFCWDMTDDPAVWETDEHGNRPGVGVQTIDLSAAPYVPQDDMIGKLGEEAERGYDLARLVERPTVPTITCPRCGATSAHPKDIAEGYCGACHDWTAEDADASAMWNRGKHDAGSGTGDTPRGGRGGCDDSG